MESLYRRTGFHEWESPAEGRFTACIDFVADDGRLFLRKRDGNLAGYDFKEVSYILP
jgi:hypothetical protein